MGCLTDLVREQSTSVGNEVERTIPTLYLYCLKIRDSEERTLIDLDKYARRTLNSLSPDERASVYAICLLRNLLTATSTTTAFPTHVCLLPVTDLTSF